MARIMGCASELARGTTISDEIEAEFCLKPFGADDDRCWICDGDLRSGMKFEIK